MNPIHRPREADDGVTNEPLSPHNIPMHMAIAAFTAIAWANVVELLVSVFMTFKRKRGLYFWSVFLSIVGVATHSLAFILKLYGVVRLYQITITMVTVGWYLMVTGQSLVLYSRLHLVVSETWIIRGVLYMIIWNAVTLHIPTTVLTYGTNSPDPEDFNTGYLTMEKIQMTIFCVQEAVISLIYIWATIRFLRPFYKRQIRSVMSQLLWINLTIIALDIAMLFVEFWGYYSLEVAMKGAVYSVKLKVEFTVLNQLMRIAKSSREARMNGTFGLEDDESDPGSGNRTGKGLRGLIRRIIPQPHGTPEENRPTSIFLTDNAAIVEPPAGSKAARQAQAHGNLSMVSAHRGDDCQYEDNMQGISVTREVTQISKQLDDDESIHNIGKPTEYYPGLGHHTNTSKQGSMEAHDDGAESDHSQLELIELPLSSSGNSLKMPDPEDYNEMTMPSRTAQPAWKTKPSLSVSFKDGGPDYYRE